MFAQPDKVNAKAVADDLTESYKLNVERVICCLKLGENNESCESDINIETFL